MESRGGGVGGKEGGRGRKRMDRKDRPVIFENKYGEGLSNSIKKIKWYNLREQYLIYEHKEECGDSL